MRAPISIVIPTLNADASLPMCLGSLGMGLEAGLIRELVISDGGSQDATQKIAEAAGAILVHGATGRGGQVARGVAAADGAWLLILHADTVLETGWVEASQAHMLRGSGKAGYFKLRFDSSGFAAGFVAGWANLRAKVLGLPYGDQGLLISSELLSELGGYPDLPLMEDVSLARALQGRLVALPATARTSASKYETEGWIRRGAKNLWLLASFYCGADPASLARRYRRSGHST